MAFVPSIPIAASNHSAFSNGCPVAKTYSTGVLANGAPSRQRAAMPSMTAISADDVPDMTKRRIMNVLLFGSASSVAIGALIPFGAFFVPVSSGGGAGGVIAKDALGNDVVKKDYLKSHLAGSRELVQGLKGDATYLIVNDAGDDLEYYALNAVCTHLGCVVPWNRAENKFKCPCHGSQYSKTGAVVRGPAPLPLALERVEEDESGKVVLKSWGKTETDFRTNEEPWWNF